MKSCLLAAERACFYTYRIRLVFLCTVVLPTLTNVANAVTLDAFDRGWYTSSGEHFEDHNNTYTGIPLPAEESYNSFFAFDLGALSATVRSGVLRLELAGYYSPNATESFGVYDVVTDVNALIQSQVDAEETFNDLESGEVYGTGVASASDVGTVLDITLSDAAISDINAAAGESFAVGVHLDVFFTDHERAVSWGSGISCNLCSVEYTHQLELTTVPLPAAVYLFGSGMVGLIGISRRKKAA